MSPGLMKMWTALGAMTFLFLSVLLIVWSRYRIKKRPLKMVTAIVAYGFLIYAGLMILLIVLSGPTIR
jgi:Protein of unknown function (DUF2768).